MPHYLQCTLSNCTIHSLPMFLRLCGMIFVSVIMNTCNNKIMATHITYTYMSQDSTNQPYHTNFHLNLKHTIAHLHAHCNNVTGRSQAKARVSVHWQKLRLRRSLGCKSVSTCNTRDCIDWHKLCHEQIPMTSTWISTWTNPNGEAFLICTMHVINDLSFTYQMFNQLYVHLTFM